MGRTLIVAEKPAQAREYASVLGVRGKGQGYLENEQYIITWCVGHLLELARPEAYMDLEKVGKRWSLKRLPVLPPVNSFQRVVKAGTLKQFQVLQKWLKSSDIDQVICGTDADREGQLLFQEVWDLVRCSKPLTRLWISSLTAEAIREGMSSLRPAEKVAGLAAAGYGRAMADWDFGMNLTEGFTALFGSFDTVRKKPNVISIGRVQTPTLGLIVEREWEIEGFVPETYFEIKADFSTHQGEYSGRWFDPLETNKRLANRQDTEKIAAKVKGQQGKIVKVEEKEVTEAPPLLFDLTSLTVTASKRFSFSAERVLELAQGLYEKKAITYPRTDCAYLPEDMLPKLPAHLNALRQEPYQEIVKEAKEHGVPRGKRVINIITAHHAIIPTTDKITMGKLTEPEQKMYDLIVRRFLAVWFPAARFHETEIITEVEGEHFRTRGRIMLSPGWKKVYAADEQEEGKLKGSKDKAEEDSGLLPAVQNGEEVQIRDVKIEEKSTKPPKRFTQGDLLKAMESAGKQIEDDVLRQQMKGKGLGTVATRPAIIESLLERGYIHQEQKNLRPTDKGMELIALIKGKLPQARLLISPEMTGQMEYDLAQVEKGELILEKYMTEVEQAIKGIIDELRSYEQKYGKTPLALAPTGKAPKGRVSKTAKTDGQTKTAKSKRQIKTAQAGEAHQNKKTTEKTDTGNEGNQERAILGPCPRCGGDVIQGQKGYGCSNWKKGCTFVVWRTPICGKVLTPAQMKSLLKKGKTPLIKGFKSKKGQTFSAYLEWEDALSGKLKFLFENTSR